MNCGRYRFLIQQRFDVEISSQDDHALIIHLETCESCQRFHHQVQQVILASEELDLPQELMPQQREALARKIVETLPQPKKSFFGTFMAFVNGFGKKTANAQTSGKATIFPHVNRAGTQPPVPRQLTEGEQEDADVLSGRLKSLPRAAGAGDIVGDSRDFQSTTRSLGERFGSPLPSLNHLEEQPLTLADAIRRKNLESKAQDVSGPQEVQPIGMPQANDWSVPTQPASQAHQSAPPMSPTSAGALSSSTANSAFVDSTSRPNNEIGSFNFFETSAGTSLPMGANAVNPAKEAATSDAAQAQFISDPQVAPWSEAWTNTNAKAVPDPWQSSNQQTAGAAPAGWDQSATNQMDPWGQPSVHQPAAPSIANAQSQDSMQSVASYEVPISVNLEAQVTPTGTGATVPGVDWGAPPQLGTWDAPEDFSENWVRRPESTSASSPPTKSILKMNGDFTPQPDGPDSRAAAVNAVPSQAESPVAPSPWEETPPFAAWQPSVNQNYDKPNEWPPSQRSVEAQDGSASTSDSSANDYRSATAGGVTTSRGDLKPLTDWGALSSSAATASGNNPVVPNPITNQPITTSIDNPASSAASLRGVNRTAQAPPSKKLPISWSPEAEQIETGPWRALIAEETLGASSQPTAGAAYSATSPPLRASAPGSSMNEQPSDWDRPIQDKLASYRARAAEFEASQTMQLGNLPPLPQTLSPMGSPAGDQSVLPVTWGTNTSDAADNPAQVTPASLVPSPPPTAFLAPVLGAQALKKDKIPDADLWELDSDDQDESSVAGSGTTQAAPEYSSTLQAVPTQLDGGQSPSGNAVGVTPPVPTLTSVGNWPEFEQATEPAPQPPPSWSGNMNTPSAATKAVSPPVRQPQTPAPRPKITSPFAPLQQSSPSSTTKSFSEPAESLPASAAMSAKATEPVSNGLQPNAPIELASPQASLLQDKTKAGLFNLDDRALDSIFENLGVNERSASVSSASRQSPDPNPPTPSVSDAAALSVNGPASELNQAPIASGSAWQLKDNGQAIESQNLGNSGLPWEAPPPIPSAPLQSSGVAAINRATNSVDDAQAGGSGQELVAQPSPVLEQSQGGRGNAADLSLQWVPSSQTAATFSPTPASSPRPSSVPGPTPIPAAPPLSKYSAPTPTPQAAGGLFSIDDSIIDRIFADNLGVRDVASHTDSAPKPHKARVTQAVELISEVAMAAPMPPPKIEGVGRLDSRPDTSGDVGSGRISSIGKFLLDGKDLEKIGKITSSDLSDTTMRILTMEAATELQSLLQSVGSQPGVIGSVIVGCDGLMIANTMPTEIDAEQIGVWALAVYMNTQNAAKKLGNERVYQIVSKTPRGYLVIADFGSGLLVTVIDARETDALVPLMRNITQLVAS